MFWQILFVRIILSLLGFLLHKDIKYETLDKKFQYYQENRDEYAELKKMLKKFVVGSAIQNVFDPISDVEEYKEVVNLFDNGEDAGQFLIVFYNLVRLVMFCRQSRRKRLVERVGL